MSSGSKKSTGSRPSSDSKSSSGLLWRQVIQLGEKLLAPARQASRDYSPALVEQRRESQRKLILETVSKLLEAQATLWLTDYLAPIAGSNRQVMGESPLSPLMRCAQEARSLCCAADATTGEVLQGRNCIPAEAGSQEPTDEIRALAIPLMAEDTGKKKASLLGLLQVERNQGPPFSAQDVDMLEGLATQSALALQAAYQMELERWRLQQLSLVRQVSAQIANVRTLEDLALRVTQLILQTFNYYYVAIFTLEPGEDILRLGNSAGPVKSRVGDQSAVEEGYTPVLSVPVGEGLVGRAAQSGEEILANDVSQEPLYRFTDTLPETRSEVTLPLVFKDRILGVLDVQSDQLHDFHETDMLVLRALAGNIAIAIEDARLYDALRRRAEQLSAVSDVSNAITSILDLDKLLTEVVNLIHDRFGYPFVHVFTVHPGRRKVFYEAGSGPRSQSLREQRFAYDLDDPQGIIPWVARQGETVLANDVESEPRYRPSTLPPADTRAELAVPLIFGGEVLGVLDVQSDRLNAFGEEDRFLFEALADNVATAMRNANLYNSERWRRQVADSLREVAWLLSADVGLEEVLDSILKELDRTLPCDVAAIWLLDEENAEASAVLENRPALRLAAVRGDQAAGVEVLQTGMSLEDVRIAFGFSPETDTESFSSWFVEALNADQPLLRQQPDSFEPLGAALDFPPDHSAIAAPLRVGEQTLGLLSLAHHTSGRYGTESRVMTTAFASYAAVAIQNTRLYEAAHEQAWVSTVLLQVSEATQTVTNLNELLATVVRITPMLVGVKACALYMLDDDQAFVPAAASGLTREQQQEFERWRFAPGEVPAFDRLLEERQALILHGEGADPILSSILLAGPDADFMSEAELLVLVPLLARGEVIGAFLIDYSNDRPGATRVEALEALFDERLSIIQGIAHQTSIAVENIRLLKSQKEEAYVSVALLQVAQAVVSSKDLDETLAAIVRITPILVGVKRSLIFLWDAENKRFRLTQSYGISRETTGLTFSPAEFSLVETVRQRDSLVAYPLFEEVEDSPGPPNSWTDLIPPDEDEVKEYLAQEDHLLLGFPLSVKGDVLGVLLVEEPDTDAVPSFGGSSARRLREKRLEIVTGISQQAALAVQNDLLQRETMERERLEREMQIAREIQRTFLPERIPSLPGWDLRVLWRTAREVGGDFYDIFKLSGTRMGLVIADVADKGMPAALFMTLIRTLVRATVREIDSPAAVLERVNDVLLPDAQQGMFVTIVYAVLDLEAGQLTYANAGHNPPLLVKAPDGHHRPGDIQRLVRSGMALGVVEGNPVEERTLQLESGDYLIFYTDGLTEAFSATGEMYQEKRLQEIIRSFEEQARKEEAEDEAQTPDAEGMLEAIEASLSKFVGSEPLADDLTLMVLKRLHAGEQGLDVQDLDKQGRGEQEADE
ncbi:MAG: GAF domain-containing protein [Anaerolineales bacterium]